MQKATLPPTVSAGASIGLRYQPAREDVPISDRTFLAIGTAGAPRAAVSGVVLPVPSLVQGQMLEIWEASLPVSRNRHNGISTATAGEFLFGAVAASPEEDLTTATTRIYGRILELARSAGRPHLVRVWNYFPRINEIETIERYQQFCKTRFEIFESAQYDMSRDLPAASAVGSATGALTVIFLASARKPTYIENPRQVSAFSYPAKYGPRSPSFSRGALLPDSRTLFVSGTASIVGHETVHEGDVAAQVEETLRNINVVIAGGFGEGASLESPELESHLKVYIRHAADQPAIAERLAQIIPAERVLYLLADICRRDLLVEIEAFVRRS